MVKNQQLAHALALYRHGNFHRAAAEKNISQPAFSRSIRSLEKELGVTLFDRHSMGVMPTPYGELLLRRAGNILEETEELEREIKLLQGLQVGNFSVAMGIYPAELSGCRAVGELVRDHPDLRCRISQSNWRDVAGQVLERNADLGLAEISVADNEERLVSELVGRHDLVFYCRKEHPLLGNAKVCNSDLDKYPLVTVTLPARMTKVFPGKSDLDKDTNNLIPSIQVDNLTAAHAVVTNSNAFSAAAPIQIEPWLRSGEFRILPYQAPWFKLNYGFIYLRNRTFSPIAQVFMDIVRRIETEVALRNCDLMKQIFPSSGGTENTK